MCDISKELQFGVIDFFYLLAFNFPPIAMACLIRMRLRTIL